MEDINMFEMYVAKLQKYIGTECTDNLLSKLPNLEKATFACNVDSGLAFDGSLVKTAMQLTTIACKINSLLPQEKQAPVESIVKVGLLSHISKALMFEENDNSWEKTNRGLLYKFTELTGALRCGERSILLCNNIGIKFTEEEFEAMRINDKDATDDTFLKLHSSALSTVIRQANEIINLINRTK